MHKQRKSFQNLLNLLEGCIFLIHWRCSTVHEAHRRRVKAMILQIMTKLEEKKTWDAWSHSKIYAHLFIFPSHTIGRQWFHKKEDYSGAQDGQT